MGRYEAAGNGLNLWDRVRLLEPAMLRGILTAIVAALAVWGVDAANVGDKIGDTWALIFPLLAVIQAWWTRTVVSPSTVNDIE